MNSKKTIVMFMKKWNHNDTHTLKQKNNVYNVTKYNNNNKNRKKYTWWNGKMCKNVTKII